MVLHSRTNAVNSGNHVGSILKNHQHAVLPQSVFCIFLCVFSPGIIQQNQLRGGRPFFLEVIDVLKAIQADASENLERSAPRITILAYGAFVKFKGWRLVQEVSKLGRSGSVAAGYRSNKIIYDHHRLIGGSISICQFAKYCGK